jgi:hypothetical protein
MKITKYKSSSDHYFPQWLMNYWCEENSGLMWCFNKETNKIERKGMKFYGCKQDLYKSDITGNLEQEVFSKIDDYFSKYFLPMAWTIFFGKQKISNSNVKIKSVPHKTPVVCFNYTMQLCFWTLIRNIDNIRTIDLSVIKTANKNHPLHALTDDELQKELFLGKCKYYFENDEAEKWCNYIKKKFNTFFVISDEKFITSEQPVQEYDAEFAENILDCQKTNYKDCSIIFFPLTPCLMFVASRHTEHKQYHGNVIFDYKFAKANYYAHHQSTTSKLFFPYQIFHPREIEVTGDKKNVKEFLTRTKKLCAIDLECADVTGSPVIMDYGNKRRY